MYDNNSIQFLIQPDTQLQVGCSKKAVFFKSIFKVLSSVLILIFYYADFVFDVFNCYSYKQSTFNTFDILKLFLTLLLISTPIFINLSYNLINNDKNKLTNSILILFKLDLLIEKVYEIKNLIKICSKSYKILKLMRNFAFSIEEIKLEQDDLESQLQLTIKSKNESRIQFKIVTHVMFGTIPQVFFQFYWLEYNDLDYILFAFLILRILIASIMCALYTHFLFKTNSIISKKSSKVLFVSLRSISNFLLISSRLITFISLSLISEWFLLFVILLNILKFSAYFFIHYKYFFLNLSKMIKFLSNFLISSLKIFSYCEDIDISSYCHLNYSLIGLELITITSLYYINCDFVSISYRGFFLIYTNLAYFVSIFVEFIGINLLLEKKSESLFIQKLNDLKILP